MLLDLIISVIIICGLYLLSLGLSLLFYWPKIHPGISMYRHPGSRPMCRKVYVGGLGNNGTVREIGNAFCCYGPLKKVWVARNPPGFAFVEFEDPGDAQNAITALDGTILCGRRIRVAFANRNSRSSSRGQSRNAPTRNAIQEGCYTCGQRGHYARDCFVQHAAMLGLEDSVELDSSFFDSDDDMEMVRELYTFEDDLYEYLQAYYNQILQHDDSSSNDSRESSNQNNRNSAQQQHRNERPQEQHRNDRHQEQHRNERPQEQHRNDRHQRQHRNGRPQEEHRNDRYQEQHRNGRPQEQHRNDQHQGQRRNERPQEHSRNDRPQEQSRNDRLQEHSRKNQSQEQCKSTSTPYCSPVSSKTNNTSDEVKCVICLDTVDDEMQYIPCGHGFHAKCCNEWLSINDICPVCRTEVGSRIGFAQMCPIS